MSGDFGPRITLPAALRAVATHPRLHLRLVGDGRTIENYLAETGSRDDVSGRISITHNDTVLPADAQPRDALRGNQDSSLHSCIDLLSDGQVDGVVSAGSTAALMALGRQRISMLPGFSRPALCSALPAKSGISYMLDLGANVDVDPQCLHEFALMGIALVEALEEISSPGVALLSNGSEPSKGNLAIREAAQRLSADARINYVGYIEASELYLGKADLIVCDGMLGNIALKAAEGTAAFATSSIRSSFRRHWWTRLLAAAVAPVLRQLQAALSADRHGGAFLLGLRGIVVKSHGASSVEAFAAAVEQAARCLEHDMVPALSRIIENQEMK
jgi:glycerol-3-phosphate acyltransferase PlsX